MNGFVDTMTNGGWKAVANGAGMWMAVIPTVIALCAQAVVFIRQAIKAGPMVGLTKDDISTAMKAGTICTIGPGMSMFTVMVAFMNLIGAPYAWLRLSIIGTITTEMLGATAGATALGVELGSPDYGIIAFCNSVWVIALNTWGFFLVNLLFAHRIEGLKNVLDRHDTQIFSIVGTCVMIGCIAQFMAGQMVNGIPYVVAGVAGFCIMLAFLKIADKKPKFGEFALGLAMLAAIFIAQIVKNMGV